MLAVLLGGLSIAGAAAAADPGPGCCCPDMVTAADDCVFLGTADCCPERPNATSTGTNATYDAPSSRALALPALPRAPAPSACTAPPALSSATRTIVLRL